MYSVKMRQISELVPFLPLLSKFSNLKQLSLHGNRIKELPVDMSQLR
jgi:Leucine-rich repeat (LRR) protein